MGYLKGYSYKFNKEIVIIKKGFEHHLCCGCGSYKPKEEFSKYTWEAKAGWCRLCATAHHQKSHKENPERRQEYQRKYRLNNLDAGRERGRKYYWNNRAKRNEYNRKWYLEHRDAACKYAKEWHRKRKLKEKKN